MSQGNKLVKSRTKCPCILITGGAGFLGSRIVQELLEDDSPILASEIRIVDTKVYSGPMEERVRYFAGDICNLAFMKKVCHGVDIVIHSAAIIDWGTKPEEEVLSINVRGTKNVIQACKKEGVSYLVYTSSLDAVFTGSPLVDIDESQPYPETHATVYCESKKLAEKAVIKANTEKLKTCILRPADIYGEADPYHIDSLINMARSGFYVRLGNGKSKCQHVYVGNMAYAHVLAAANFWNGKGNISGQIYFITDGKGSNFFSFFDQVVRGAGYKIFPRNLWLPRWLAYTIGSLSEAVAILMRPIHHYNPKFSRFAVTYTCTDFTFSAAKALRDFGFKPKYSTKEALAKTCEFYRNQR